MSRKDENKPNSTNETSLDKNKSHNDSKYAAKFAEMKSFFKSNYSDVIDDDIRGRRMNVGAPMHLVFRKDIEIIPYHVSIARPIPLHFKEQALQQIQKMIDEC